jgi:hypothetical protein
VAMGAGWSCERYPVPPNGEQQLFVELFNACAADLGQNAELVETGNRAHTLATANALHMVEARSHSGGSVDTQGTEVNATAGVHTSPGLVK